VIGGFEGVEGPGVGTGVAKEGPPPVAIRSFAELRAGAGVEDVAVGADRVGLSDEVILIRLTLRSFSAGAEDGPAAEPSIPGRGRVSKGGSGGVLLFQSFCM
jgi:hypothetical protein